MKDYEISLNCFSLFFRRTYHLHLSFSLSLSSDLNMPAFSIAINNTLGKTIHRECIDLFMALIIVRAKPSNCNRGNTNKAIKKYKVKQKKG